MGAPNSYSSSLRVVTISKPSYNSNSGGTMCLVTNGLTGLSNGTIETGSSFLATASYSRWVLLLSRYDPLADTLLREYINHMQTGNRIQLQYGEQNVTVDSGYAFLSRHISKCAYFAYSQQTQVVSAQQVEYVNSIAQPYYQKPNHLLYTSKALNTQGTAVEQLSNLNVTSL